MALFPFFGFYDLILASVLFLNAVAIINERFLRQYGLRKPGPGDPPTVKNRLLTLLYGDLKTILQMPLMWVNMLFIVAEVLIG